MLHKVCELNNQMPGLFGNKGLKKEKVKIYRKANSNH